MTFHAKTAVVAALFFLSGVSSLMFETAWTRLFLSLFGHGIQSTSAVLAAFMGGLGFGALVGGRWAEKIRRPMRGYAVLETTIALWVVTSPFQVSWTDALAAKALAGFAGPVMADVIAWGAAFGLLLIPSCLMGATLPVLCRVLFGESEAIGRVLGLLYGINTLGAVLGVVGAGFWSIRHLGVQGSLWMGCALNLVAAAGALLLDRCPIEAVARAGSGDAEDASLKVPWWIIGAVSMAGWCAMAFEVVWIRLFVFILGSNILSLATVLGTLLLALSLGALILPRVVRSRERHLEAFAWAQLILAASALGGLLALERLEELLAAISVVSGGVDPLSGGWGRQMVVVAVVFVPGIAMGATLPAASGAITSVRGAEREIGRLYAANTFGNIFGALAGGYLLVPIFGAARSLVVISCLNLIVASLLFCKVGLRRRPAKVSVALFCAAASMVLAFDSDRLHEVFSDRKVHGTLLEVSEGRRGTVTVLDVPPLPLLAANADRRRLFSVGAGYRLLAVDGVDVAGSSPDLRTTQLMQAHVPLLLHGDPKRVLQIGHGSGATAVAVDSYGCDVFDLVEINPAVIAHANIWFPEWQGARFNPFFTDAKNFVRRTARTYDVILNDSTYPGRSGSSQLYSEDHFRACRDRLAPGGIVSTWLPVDLPVESFATVLASFRSVFPSANFWLPLNCWNKHGVLVGSEGSFEDAVSRIRTTPLPEAAGRDLSEIGLVNSEVFASGLVLDSTGVKALAAEARRNDDDHPSLEYPARGWAVAGEDYWHETLDRIRANLIRQEGKERAVERLIEGQLLLLENRPDEALKTYREAALMWPEHPGAAKLTEDVSLFRAQRILAESPESRPDLIQTLEAVVTLCPFSAVARFELGRALFEDRRYSECVPHLDAAIELGEGVDRAWLYLGDVMALGGRPREAEKDFRTYLESNKPVLEILVALGDVVAEQGRSEEALDLFRAADALSPGSEIVADRLSRFSEPPWP